MKKLLFLILLIPNLILAQCAGTQSFTLTPAPVNGNYEPGTVVTMCYTMSGWSTAFGANWIEGFDINLGPGWVSYAPVTAPGNCSANGNWLWLETVTSDATALVAGPGYFYEGPTGPVDGNTGNDWGDFGTTCNWTFCIQLQVTDQCDPLSLLIEVTPMADGTIGSWGNEACFDPAFQVFNGTVAGGNVNTTPIALTTDTTCFFQNLSYSVNLTPGSSYDWNLSGGGLLSENGSNIAQVYWGNQPGDYTLTVQETTVDGCVGDLIDTVITVVEPYTMLGTPYAVCPGTSVSLFAMPAGGTWSGYNIENNTFQSDTSGFFYATYTVNIFGCVVTDSVSVTVTQPPVSQNILNNGLNLDLCVVPRMQSYYMPDDPGVIYTWHVDGDLINDDDFELQMNWADSTTYHYITVYGTDSAGCKGEESYLTVSTNACHRLFVPNSFTPNGDGYNDGLRIAGLAVYNLDLKLYNRYGQVVCNLKSVAQAWDGNDGSGYYCPTGIYNWMATYTDDRGFGHTQKGHVLLLR
jgi:gliding motility-associated-like protein